MALAVDLVPEYDGDDSYRTALLAAAAKTDKPLAVLTSIPAAIDTDAAVRLRGSGIPVLESTCTGLQALRHLLAHPATSPGQPHPSGSEPAGTAQPAISSAPANTAAASVRRSRWSAALAARPLPAADLFAMLRDYGIPAVRAASAATVDQALAAAAAIGYPVALKTDMPGISHKSDVGGVRLGIMDPAELADAYADVSPALAPGSPSPKWPPQARNSSWAWPATRPWAPLIIVGAGGVLAERLAERAVALPPLTSQAASTMLGGLRVAQLLNGVRGQPPCDRDAIVSAIVAFSALVADLGEQLAAFDVNPLICSPGGVLAVDALAIPAERSIGEERAE